MASMKKLTLKQRAQVLGASVGNSIRATVRMTGALYEAGRDVFLVRPGFRLSGLSGPDNLGGGI